MEEQAFNELENIPFEEQEKFGAVRSFIATVAMLIISPKLFFERMHINKGYKLPLIFLVIMLTGGNTFNYIYLSTGLIEHPSKQVAQVMENEPELSAQAQFFKDMINAEPEPYDIIVGIVSNLLFFYLMALYWHLILRSLSVALNGFQATFRVFCYSSVVLSVSLLPYSSATLNLMVYLWWVYLVYRGISEAHEVSGRLTFRGITVSLFATMIPLIFATIAVF